MAHVAILREYSAKKSLKLLQIVPNLWKKSSHIIPQLIAKIVSQFQVYGDNLQTVCQWRAVNEHSANPANSLPHLGEYLWKATAIWGFGV